MNKRSPWAWVPTLYFAEGLPYVAVMTISLIMYKRLGLSNTAITLYTSWLYLPWVIKPLWSPFIDIIKTGIHHPCPLLAARHTGLLLADGLLECHP